MDTITESIEKLTIDQFKSKVVTYFEPASGVDNKLKLVYFLMTIMESVQEALATAPSDDFITEFNNQVKELSTNVAESLETFKRHFELDDLVTAAILGNRKMEDPIAKIINTCLNELERYDQKLKALVEMRENLPIKDL